uniref:Receptor ligand binding region domain-containing protein n=2 Tax=Dendroctonus ponderosae TaxID=77166 RepID=A0AAR5P0S4_DENPD
MTADVKVTHMLASEEGSKTEVHIAPTGRELVQALRGLLLQAHWHTFTVLADPASATSLRSAELWHVLGAAPLHPTLVALPSPLRPQSLFRKLADISRSTRGVVVLCSDSKSAIQILSEAKRLNMMDGHFVWIWVDTASSINIRNASEKDTNDRTGRDIVDREKRSAFLTGDINELHINYLLKNDPYLLLNRHSPSVASSKLKRQPPEGQPSVSFSLKSEKESVLPAGLLSLRPLPIKVDRNLVKGAVRLLMSTFQSVLGRYSAANVQKIINNKFSSSCWSYAQKELSFPLDFG